MSAPRSQLHRIATFLIGHAASRRLNETQRLQALIAALTSVLGSVAVAVTLTFAWSVFPEPIRLAALTSFVMFGAVVPLYRLVVPRKPGATVWIHHLVPAALFVSCGSAAILIGGVLPLAAIYSPAIPLLTVMICSVRASVIWSSLMATTLLVGMVNGPVLEAQPPLPSMALAGSFTVLVPTLLSLLVHRQIWEQALRAEREAQRRLQDHHENQRQLDKRLSAHERSESLALMAGRVAHDLNNFLTAVSGNVQLAQIDLQNQRIDQARAGLQAVARAAEAARQLAGDLLDYTGKRHLTLQHVELTDRVRRALALARASIPGGIEVDYHAGAPIWVEGDPIQIDQVVVNLVRNAAQACEVNPSALADADPSRTKIEVRLQVVHDILATPQHNAAAAPYQPRHPSLARLEVTDSGRGIDPAVRERIFEPFYTDRPQGKGLGLASVLGIVQAHGGRIEVDSEPGRGSTFRVLLPVAEAPNEKSGDAIAIRQGPVSGRSILVVDDEESVRSVVCSMIERFGYEPIPTSDGRSAVERVGHGTAPAAAVLDIVMPGLDGHATAQELRNIHPDLPIVLISGYSPRSPRYEDPKICFLQKPFSANALAESLERLGLSSRAAASDTSDGVTADRQDSKWVCQQDRSEDTTG